MTAAQYVWGDTGTPLPVLDFIRDDPSWRRCLPAGCKIITNVGYGSSYWSQAAKIEARLTDGTIARYFVKLTETHIGRLMAEGEYEGTKELYKYAPEMVPQPVGWGTYESDPNLHFFICEFVDIFDEEYPEKVSFCKAIADMHKRSIGGSPTGKFGFHVITCNGTIQQANEWTESWEDAYVQKLQYLFKCEQANKGPSAELDRLKPLLFDKVCPRLLRPLETDGRTLSPTLLHVDLWHGNTAKQVKPGEPPLIFDASAMWGHNEYDLHAWRGGHYEFDLDWVREYFKNYPPSEPADDWHDRNLLYYLSSCLHSSILWPQSDRYRGHAIETITTLVNKYPEGYTGSCPRKGL